MISPKITNLGYSNLWTDMSTILGYASTFDQQIQKLFANNEQGFVYDPNDLSTMYQDSEGTIPVTAAGQLVGLILDKSGQGNHARQTTSASRPILQRNATTGANYLEFDGTDDFLQTANIDFTATDKLSLFAGVQKMPATTVNMLCELSSNSAAGSQANAFYLAVPETSGGTIFFRSRTTSGTNQIARVESGGGVRNCVITAKSDIPNDLNTISIDGVSSIPSTGDLGIGNLGNYPLHIGRRGGIQYPFNGHIYSLIGVGRLTTDAETATLEKLIAKNTGVTLSV